MGVAFVIVMVVLVFLAITGLAIKYFTRGATRVAESVLAGEQAMIVARSAMDEAWASFEQHVNDPGDTIFTMFRYVIAPNNDNAITIQFESKSTSGAYSADPNIEISAVELHVPRQYAIWNKNPLEKYGHVRATVTVRVTRPALRRTSVRTLRQWREFKVLYPSPARPFGNMTFFQLSTRQLEAWERRYRELMKDVDDKIRKEEKRLSKKKPFGSVDLPRPFENNPVENRYKYFPNYKYPPYPFNTRALPPGSYADPPPLDQSDMENYLLSLEPELRGEHHRLKWPTNLEQVEQDPLFQQMLADLSAAEAQAATSGTTPDAATIADLEAKLDALKSGDALKTFENFIIASLDEYQRHFKIIDEDKLSDFNETYLAPLMDVDGNGVINVDAAMAQYRLSRCTHDFPTQDKLWDELGGSSGQLYLDGVYFVDGTIDVNMAYRGRGTIIGRNKINVNACTKADGKTDKSSVCTIMSFCKPDTTGWASISLNCDVEAGLVAVTGLIQNLHLHDVFGSLAVGFLTKEVVDGYGDKEGKTYPWTLTYDPALMFENPDNGTIYYDRARVFVSPTLIASEVYRE